MIERSLASEAPWPLEASARGRVPFILVVGAGHSGSTLLSFVLNNHPAIFAIGEMHAPVFPKDDPARRLCSCGASMARCDFFRRVRDRLAQDRIEFVPTSWDLRYSLCGVALVDRLLVGSLRSRFLEACRAKLLGMVPPYRRAVGEIHRRTLAFVRAVLDLSAREVFLDASKDPLRLRYLLQIAEFDLKAIHLVRDPRSYAHSRMRDAGLSAAAAARSWLRMNRHADRQLRLLPRERWTRLRYEELCLRPEEALQRLTGFLGLPPMDVPANYRAREHHIMGNKMRLSRAGSAQIRLDERWKSGMAPAAIDVVVRLTGRHAARYGYGLA